METYADQAKIPSDQARIPALLSHLHESIGKLAIAIDDIDKVTNSVRSPNVPINLVDPTNSLEHNKVETQSALAHELSDIIANIESYTIALRNVINMIEL